VWSSHRAVLGQVPAPGWLAVDDALIGFAPTRELARSLYRRFVNEGIRSEKRLWDDVVGQQYLGRPEWIDLIRGRIDLKPRSAEIPRSQLLLVRPSMKAVISAVSETFFIPEARVRSQRGSVGRMVAAWLGWRERLTQSEISHALSFRGHSEIARLVGRCDREMASNPSFRDAVDRCRSTVSRKLGKAEI